MRTAIVYASVHHGNTEKLVKRIAEECQVNLIDAVKQPDADLSSYDMIGFASGIYFSRFHQSILEFAEKNLPDDKKIFLICTYGGSANYKSIEQILDKKHASVVGKFGCLPPAVVSARMQFVFSGKRRIGYCTAVLAMIVCG